MKDNIYYLLILLILGQVGCVSSRHYKALVAEIRSKDEIIKALKVDSSSLYQSFMALDIKNFELSEDLNRLKLLLENHSNSGEMRLFPMIPIPPPLPTDHMVLTKESFKKYRKYYQLDSLLSRSFIASGYQKTYMAVENGGFAIVTNFEEIDKNGNQVHSTSTATMPSLYSLLTQRIKEVFFSKIGFYRCIVILVSSNLYELGGDKITFEELKSWLDGKAIRLPNYISNANVDDNIEVVALLYEFEQNENTGINVQIIDRSKAKTQLSKMPIIKKIIDAN